MLRQLTEAVIRSVLWAVFVGALGGGLMLAIAFGENLAGHIVDLDGRLDVGFLARIFFAWFAPIAAATLGIGLLARLIAAAVRWAAGRVSQA